MPICRIHRQYHRRKVYQNPSKRNFPDDERRHPDGGPLWRIWYANNMDTYPVRNRNIITGHSGRI